MATLSHQSYANVSTPLWLSATSPAIAQSPLAIVNSVGNPTKQTTISVSGAGTSDFTLANYGTGNSPIRMRFSQPVGVTQGIVSFNTGNVQDALAIGQTSTTSYNEFRVAVSGSATSNLVLSNTANGGTLNSGLATLTLSNNGILDFGGYFRMGSLGYVYSNALGSNGDTSTMKYFRTSGSPSATVGGMGIIGTDGALYFGTSNFTTNFSNITAYQFAIDKYGVVGTYGACFQIHDPVTFSNSITFSNSAGQGYLDLVANSGLLYNQIQFGSNATSLPRETIVFGNNTTALVSAYATCNSFGLTDPTQVVSTYLNTSTHQWVFSTQARTGSNITSMVIETNGSVSFPQGINVSSFLNPVLNGLILTGTNASSGIIVNSSPVTISNYSPVYYVFGALSSQNVTFDLRGQAGYGSHANGSFWFQFWNTSSFSLPVFLVTTNSGSTDPLATVPPNNCLMVMIDFGQLQYNKFMFASSITTAGNNYMIV